MSDTEHISFVMFPRSDLQDLHTGKIKRSEYELYTYIRHGADPYANAKVSLEGLAADFVHRKWNKNYINKLLLALKKKGYIHYEERKGRKGTFEVRFAGIKMPRGGMSVLQGNDKAEVGQSLPTSGQSFADIETKKKALIGQFSASAVRGFHNDHDHENKKERLPSPLTRNTFVERFIPKTDEQGRCKEIAVALGERTMDFLLATLHTHGIGLVERAWVEYKRADATIIKNRPAYFNGIVQTLIEKRANPP